MHSKFYISNDLEKEPPLDSGNRRAGGSKESDRSLGQCAWGLSDLLLTRARCGRSELC
jgi:hypothetical protein